ncbi:hypothetical protein [Fusibacter sp. JL216-2]|uniref:hypothetical protein n=1 Tax=Fusibacter sp. JL216-2 TaxID=3071453 RepID=UPI003D34D700
MEYFDTTQEYHLDDYPLNAIEDYIQPNNYNNIFFEKFAKLTYKELMVPVIEEIRFYKLKSEDNGNPYFRITFHRKDVVVSHISIESDFKVEYDDTGDLRIAAI